MSWVWKLYEQYIRKQLANAGNADPTEAELESAFLRSMSRSSVTILVQVPIPNSVRFKGLARGSVLEMSELLTDPMSYLREHYGGGKFKLNFHEGWHFVSTKNFKPEGPPRWQDMPEITF